MKTAASLDEETQATIKKIERRQWWLWSNAVAVTILLTLGVSSFVLPKLLSGTRTFEPVLRGTVPGLAALGVLFIVSLIFEQVQINRLRRRLTNQVAAMDKLELMAQEVYRVAVLDPLTGLFNRRYIERRLEDEISRAQRHRRPLTLILFDLDGFKQVNDTYGHAAGDDLLRTFGENLGKATRGSDVAGRLGGDEFLVLLPECKPEEVQFVLNRMNRFRIQIGASYGPLAYSYGCATHVSGESAAELVKRADDALYASKRRISETEAEACPSG